MFLAIINDAYSEVKAEMSRQKHDFEMIDFFKKVNRSCLFWYCLLMILKCHFRLCKILLYIVILYTYVYSASVHVGDNICSTWVTWWYLG